MIATRTVAAIAAAVAIAAAAWWHTHAVDAAHAKGMAEGAAKVQAQWDAAKLAQSAAVDAARTAAEQHQQEQAHAINTAQSQRAQAQQSSQDTLDRLAAERDGLRRNLTAALNTIRSCGAMPATSSDAAADRGAAVEAVFAAMERAGAAMARAADGHAADSLMLQRAWPR
jgi:hypothetical protein